MQREEGDDRREKGDDEKRPRSDERKMPGVRNRDVQNIAKTEVK